MEKQSYIEQLTALCREFIERHIPAESPFFDFIWRAYWNSLPDDYIENFASYNPVMQDDISILHPGAAGKQHPSRFESSTAIKVFNNVALSLYALSTQSSLTLNDLNKAIEVECKRFAVPARTQKLLLNEGAAFLTKFLAISVSLHGQEINLPEGERDESDGSNDTSLFVVMLYQGKLISDHYRERYVKSLPARCPGMDLIIDEPNYSLKVASESEPKRILELPKSQRGMLWLALTHVGKYISHEEIMNQFGFQSALDKSRIYQYRRQLGLLVGDDLRNRMMLESRQANYFVPETGWSFLWIRDKEEARSLLLHN